MHSLMKILIVNGGTSPTDYARYCSLIKQCFHSNLLLDADYHFILKDAQHLDQFLYDSIHSTDKAAMEFDQLDFIFLQLQNFRRPWEPFVAKILILLRMCIKANKILLASSAAMQALVFLIATDFEEVKQVEIINSNEGSSLGDLTRVSVPLASIQRHQLFLDNITGDLYRLNYDHLSQDAQWIPIANAGIHQRRAAQEYQSIGKFIIKSPTYKPKQQIQLEKNLIQSLNEEVCSVKNSAMQHYVFKDIPKEFIVPSKHSWDIHSFNVVNPGKTFVTLAESKQGPSVIAINSNLIATQFTIDSKYAHTHAILNNFIQYHLNKIMTQEIKQLQIKHQPDAKQRHYLQQLHKGDHNQNLKFTFLTQFQHVGYSAKKQERLNIVHNNAIGTKITIKKDKMKIKDSSRQLDHDKLSLLSHNPNDLIKEPVSSDNLSPLVQTQAQIRKILHPSISNDCLTNDKPLWVPGNFKLNHEYLTNRLQRNKSVFNNSILGQQNKSKHKQKSHSHRSSFIKF